MVSLQKIQIRSLKGGKSTKKEMGYLTFALKLRNVAPSPKHSENTMVDSRAGSKKLR